MRSNMSKARRRKEEFFTPGVDFRSPTSLAAIESLDIPLVQEVVFFADFRCPQCQKRVAQIMTKMNGETQSVVISVLEKKVTLTSHIRMLDQN